MLTEMVAADRVWTAAHPSEKSTLRAIHITKPSATTTFKTGMPMRSNAEEDAVVTVPDPH
ncbi:hypothetical protein [Rhizobium laguerreae]|uniref:hypothetical protein n=1 Tax=Rhizobium laguerreae TaxID=1076926 RepID=UPI0021B0DB53|nr:hypothetical protein [Rhizobium laguerreae]